MDTKFLLVQVLAAETKKEDAEAHELWDIDNPRIGGKNMRRMIANNEDNPAPLAPILLVPPGSREKQRLARLPSAVRNMQVKRMGVY